LAKAPDIVVLGSSNSIWLGENIFPDKKIINNSVTNALLADYLGIFEGYARKSLFPARVILFLNPQLILFPITFEYWVSIKEDTYSMLGRLGIRSEKIKQPLTTQAWQDIFSFSHFQESIKTLFHRHHQQNHLANQDIAGGQVFYKDGRHLWDWGLLSNDTEKNRRETIRGLYHGLFQESVRNHMKPDKDLKDILENFIRYLMGHHIKVALCLLPIHPEQYKSFLELQKNLGSLDIVDIEHYYHGLAQRLNLEIIGSFDPAVCNLESNDFFDGYHLRNGAIERIFKQKGSKCSMPGL
jgi:hypothetical protein